MIAPTRKFLSLNKSISSKGTFPFLFLLISNQANIARITKPKTITATLEESFVSIKIPQTNKISPITEIIVPVMSKSFLDSVGLKSGILCCITKISITNINSTANPHLQLKNVVMTPPNRGPTAAEMETITLSIAKANVRCSPEYIPLIKETVAGVINAPAIPSINAHPINKTGVLQLIAAVNVPIP